MRWLVSALVFLLTLPGWAAFTERYVTSAASGGGVGTEGDPWTVAEAASSGVAGDRINVQSDSGYTLGSTTLSSPGTAAALLVWRGYDTVIGDLEGLGRNADGTLVVTGFPVFTMSGSFVPSAFSIVQNISFTGAINSPIFGNTAVDNWKLVSCNVLNTNSGGSTYGVRGDNSATLINCDVECSGATSVATFNADATPLVFGCRLKGTGNLCSAAAIRVYNTVFIGDGSAKGVVVENKIGRASCRERV